MPSDAALKFMNTAHRALLKLSFGKLGWKAGSMPVLELMQWMERSGKHVEALGTITRRASAAAVPSPEDVSFDGTQVQTSSAVALEWLKDAIK